MREKVLEAIEIARSIGSRTVEVDGIKFEVRPINEVQAEPLRIQSDDEVKKAFLDVELDLTDEEVLFWATPYYDELQEKKKARQEALAEEKQLRDEVDHGENS